MGLTVAEKEHWKSRIAKRIDHRIETLVAKQDPTAVQPSMHRSRRRDRATRLLQSPPRARKCPTLSVSHRR